jgi:peptide/nickel transport system substrate-binding protein
MEPSRAGRSKPLLPAAAGGISRRGLLRGLALAGLATSTSTGPGVRAASAQAQPKRGGTVVIATYQEANSLNWILVGTPSGFGFMQQYPIFEPMLRISEKIDPEPALLAEVPTVQNGGISPDGLTYTLRMRPGLQWSDGQPCTIRDWIFTWRWIVDPKNKAVGSLGWNTIASAEAKDDLTAIVKLKQPYVPFIAETLAGFPALPEHVQSKMTTEAFGRRPVGNGPFKFVEWVTGDHITLERNPLYWRPQKAWLDRIIWKVVPDRNTVIAQAKTGAIDIGVDYTEAQIPEISNIPNVDVLISRQNVIERYHFTIATNEDVKKKHHLWGDVNLRKAVTLATDRQTIINTVLHGKTRIAKTQLDNTPYENTGIKPHPFDPAQARRVLDEAGWKPGPDGIRVKDGVRLSFTHTTTAGNQTRETIQAMVQANLKDVGIEMKIQNFPGGTFFASFLEGGAYISRKYDMMGVAGGLASIDPNIRLYYHSAEIPTKESPKGLNLGGLADAELDRLLDAQLQTLDNAKRKELLFQAQQRIHDIYGIMPMYVRLVVNTVNKRVRGLKAIDFGSVTSIVWNTHEWWVA